MRKIATLLPILLTISAAGQAQESAPQADAKSLATQNAALRSNTEGRGFGPQSPRDLDRKSGYNQRIFATSPPASLMNLCNIHFHKNAEHKGGEFTTFAGYGDGHGHGSGYTFSGSLTPAESRPLDAEVCVGDHGGLQVGDTIEVHYVHSSAQVQPGPTLGACLSEGVSNPQLRVEAQVFVLVNDVAAVDFTTVTALGRANGFHQATKLPQNTGQPINYKGSTTGPAFNEKGSPLQVSWSVRPKVLKVDAASVGRWCKDNVFKEDHAHGVRNLIVDEFLLSTMQ